MRRLDGTLFASGALTPSPDTGRTDLTANARPVARVGSPRPRWGAVPFAAHVPLRRESRMPKVVITHAVEDIDRWLQGKEKRTAAIESGTGSNVTDYVAADGSTNIAITADVADLAAMQAML